MIYGEEIRLRAIERTDLERYVAWFNDPEVTQHLMRHLPISLADEERWFENQQKLPEEGRAMALDARDGKQWVHIGGAGLHDIDWQSRLAEAGISIGDKRYWDRGFGTDAMRALLRHGFETLNLHRVYLRVFEDNERAIAVYRRLGFVEEGRLRKHFYRRGEYRDMLIMGILKSEWQQARGGKA
jgi:RimJ/RimL family protein N-acetyltransferase